MILDEITYDSLCKIVSLWLYGRFQSAVLLSGVAFVCILISTHIAAYVKRVNLCLFWYVVDWNFALNIAVSLSIYILIWLNNVQAECFLSLEHPHFSGLEVVHFSADGFIINSL